VPSLQTLRNVSDISRDQIKLQYFPGHTNKEIAVLHIPTRTLVQADLIFNLPCTEQYAKSASSGKAFWPLSIFQSKAVAGHCFIPNMTSKDKVYVREISNMTVC
jgi:hypothetical protein